MSRRIRIFWIAAMGAAGLLLLSGGCPTGTPSEFIPGQTGATSQLGTTVVVNALAPADDLSVAGGTPVEVVWRITATSPFATIDVSIDNDVNPDNGVVQRAFSNLPLGTNSALLDTTNLQNGTFFILVQLRQFGEIVASDYAPGSITIDQRPLLFFNSPRDNFSFDRSSAINPSFDVSWTLDDPDSVVSVRIFLDPDDSPNGNEVLLRRSNSQTGDAFSFDLPTASFEPGVYRLLAVVSDGVNDVPFYNPGSIRIRSRLAGFQDLRNLAEPDSPLAGAVFAGFNPGDNAGTFIRSVRDIDADGFDDFMILAQFGKPQYEFSSQRTGIGEAYLIYGRPQRFSGLIGLNSTGTLFRGEIYGGVPQVPDPIRPSRGITSFTLLSDWDGDGVREFAFGLPFTDSRALETFTPSAFAPLDVNGYFRTGGVVIAAGSSLRPDLGFPGRNVFNLAEFGTLSHEPVNCLAFGNPPCPCPEGFYGPKAPDLPFYNRHYDTVAGTPNVGSIRLGCRWSTNDFNDQFGETVAAYDFDSILVSAPNRDPVVSTLRGASAAGGGVISLWFCDRKSGFTPWSTTQAPPANAAFGYAPAIFTNNLLPHGGPYHYIMDDLRLGFLREASVPVGFIASPGYFVDEDDSPNPACRRQIDLRMSFPDFSVRFYSETPGARLSNVQAIDDFNADGLLDLLIGAPRSNDGAGAVYVILGRVRDLVRNGELRLEELALPAASSTRGGARIFDGIRILGAPGSALGTSQDRAGDFNGDGLPDVVIGSPLVNNRQGGAAVFFGTREAINLTEGEILFDDLPNRGLGVIFVGEEPGDLAGARVVGPGDIDGDGLDDLLIAAPNKSVRLDLNQDGVIDIDRTNCGVVYLIYGSPNLRGTLSLSQVGTAALPGAVFIGASSGDFLGAGLGGQGDRSFGCGIAGDVDGDGRQDIVLSAVRASPRSRVGAGEVYLIYGTGD